MRNITNLHSLFFWDADIISHLVGHNFVRSSELEGVLFCGERILELVRCLVEKRIRWVSFSTLKHVDNVLLARSKVPDEDGGCHGDWFLTNSNIWLLPVVDEKRKWLGDLLRVKEAFDSRSPVGLIVVAWICFI